MSGWESRVRRTVPYIPGEQPKEAGIIKLNTNENPYPPCPGVAHVLAELDCGRLRRYPDPDALMLREAIAKDCGVDVSRVYAGVGSDDVLAMCFLTFFNSGDPVLFPDVTYSFYEVWADVFRVPFETVPLTEDLLIRPEDYMRENGGIIFPNPNAPTGALLGRDAVEQIVRANPGSVVIVDEAYIAFGGESVLPLTEQYDNLLVVRTLSKSHSMAGMRIGYAVGSGKLIAYLMDVRNAFNSYTLNMPAILAGTMAVEDRAYFECCRGKVVATRERLKEQLRALGFSFPDSKANFLFVTHPEVPAQKLFADLRRAGILVRYFNRPRISDYLRITVGTDEETDALILALRTILKKETTA